MQPPVQDSGFSAPVLFSAFNAPVPFDRLGPGDIEAVTARVIRRCRELLSAMSGLPVSALRFDNTFGTLDEVYSLSGTVQSTSDLLANVHPEQAVREAAMKALSSLSRFRNEWQLDESVYRPLKTVAESGEHADRAPAFRKFMSDVIRDFEREGLSLDSGQREELRRRKDRLKDLEIAFVNNIESDHAELRFSETEAGGLPDDYLDERRQPDGSILVDLSYPSYFPFMKYAHDDAARKRLFMRFNTRAPQNKPVLHEMLSERRHVARMLGFDSFAAYRLDDSMAATPAAVWAFENDVNARIRPKAEADLDRLLDIKRGESPVAEPVIRPWQSAYYVNKLVSRSYGLNQEEVKAYFPLDRVMEGIFGIVDELFGVRFRLAEGATWHEDVRLYALQAGDKDIARLYTDFFPRRNKYGHAACFDITAGRRTAEGYVMPSVALVCNFPRPSGQTPSLLTHQSVVTLFHEFGHALHHLLTTSPLHYFAGTRVATDFVEVPSQLFEHWAWEYESLQRFARHHLTGEPLPRSLHEKMMAARNADSGLHVAHQLFYGILDLTLHDRFDPGSGNVSDVVHDVQNRVSMYPWAEGTHMETAFGHLQGYAAGYYSYLWSRVYADDMFGEFQRNGLFDPATARRLRDDVLARGATVREMDTVRGFLGREPRLEAFLTDLGIEERRSA